MDGLTYSANGGVGSPQGIQQYYANMVRMNDMASNLGDESGMSFNSGLLSMGGQYGQYAGQYNQYPGQNGQYPGSETQRMSLIDLDAYQAQRQKLQLGQQTDYQKAQIEQQIEMQKQGAKVNFEVSGSDNAIKNAIGFLADAISENKQDEVAIAYAQVETAYRSKLKESGVTSPVTSYQKKIFDAKVKADINDLYFEATKTNLAQDLKAHGDSPLKAGFKSGLDPFGWFTNSKSVEANLRTVGAPGPSKDEERVETNSATTGKYLGYAALALAVPVVAVFAPKLLKGLFKGGAGLFKAASGTTKSLAKDAPLAGEKLAGTIADLEAKMSEAKILNRRKIKPEGHADYMTSLGEKLKELYNASAKEKLAELAKIKV